MSNTDWIEEVLVKFADYWRNDPQHLLDKLSPQEAAAEIRRRIRDEYLRGYNTGWQKANRNTGLAHSTKKLSEIMQIAEELRNQLQTGKDTNGLT